MKNQRLIAEQLEQAVHHADQCLEALQDAGTFTRDPKMKQLSNAIAFLLMAHRSLREAFVLEREDLPWQD